MISIKIPEEVRYPFFMKTIHDLVLNGAESLEFTVYSFGTQKLIIIINQMYATDSNDAGIPIYLDDLFRLIKQEDLTIQIILNLAEPNLEVPVNKRVLAWDLRKQVKYAGKLDPMYLNVWDRSKIFYNVENCLPNFYQLGKIKKTHFDVIHYFCNKYKVKTLRMHENKLTPEVMGWTDEYNLKLSIYGVETYERAAELFEKGVNQITTRDKSLVDRDLVQEA